jgi:hypothetical protein
MTDKNQFNIIIGKDPADGKWYAQCTLPDGKILSTKAYDTHAQCRYEVEEFLREKEIKYTLQGLQ